MSVIQEEIDRIRDSLNALEAMLPGDKPKPRQWRPWDMVYIPIHGCYLRLPKFAELRWYPLSLEGAQLNDAAANQRATIYLGNLADMLKQGDVLVGLTEDETTYICELWAHLKDGSTMAGVAHKCEAALAARKENYGGPEHD